MARRIVGTVWGLALLALAFWLATRIPRTVTVFLTAAVIALGVHPVTEFLERWVRRPVAIAIVYLVLFGGTVFLALLVIPTAISQTELVIANLPNQFSSFDRYLSDF